jgi:hypothetical protein
VTPPVCLQLAALWHAACCLRAVWSGVPGACASPTCTVEQAVQGMQLLLKACDDSLSSHGHQQEDPESDTAWYKADVKPLRLSPESLWAQDSRRTSW